MDFVSADDSENPFGSTDTNGTTAEQESNNIGERNHITAASSIILTLVAIDCIYN